jgi:hypothetical protein
MSTHHDPRSAINSTNHRLVLAVRNLADLMIEQINGEVPMLPKLDGYRDLAVSLPSLERLADSREGQA